MYILCGSFDIFRKTAVSMYPHDLKIPADIMTMDLAGVTMAAAYHRVYGNLVTWLYIGNIRTDGFYDTAEFMADQARIGGERVCTIVDSDVRTTNTAGCDADNDIISISSVTNSFP